ncbi:MAG: DsbA family protein [Acidobacteria bacterium]|nr:DsbA family protein [Acidobacteriota bacterium]
MVIGMSGLAAGQTERKPNAAGGCPELQASYKATILDRVRSLRGSAAPATVVLTEDTLVPGSCYHKLVYQVQTERRSYTLYLSPDQRFLSYSLFEVRPAAAQPGAVPAAMAGANQCSSSIASPHALDARADVPKANLTSKATAAAGSDSAPVTVVIFSDFQCPYCKKAAEWLRADLAEFGTGKLRVVFRFFPLSFHAWAQPAAEAAACVAAQDQPAFWKVHDSIFADQAAMTPANVRGKLLEYIQSIPGLNVAAYKRCLESGQAADAIRYDQNLGASYQVRGTPAVFVNGLRLPGLRSAEQLHVAIEQAAGTNKMAANR